MYSTMMTPVWTDILMVTAGMSDADTLRAFENGCCGIFLKHSPPAQLTDAIYKVVAGETWLDSRAVKTWSPASQGRPIYSGLSNL